MFLARSKYLFDTAKPVTTYCNVLFSSVPESVSSTESIPVSTGKPKKDPFIKNVFLGKFDPVFLEFEGGRKDLSGKSLDVLSKLNISSVDGNTNFQKSVSKLNILAKNGFFKLKLPNIYGGVDLTYCELLQIYEKLDLDPTLALLLEVQSSYVIPSLLNHCAFAQNEVYLKKLVNGEITGAFAVSEKTGGSDPFSINLVAKESNDSFILNGEKVWVVNATNADFYIVFAKTRIDNLRIRSGEVLHDISAFLVDKTDNIRVDQHSLLGLKDTDLGTLHFENCSIPKNRLIGALGDGVKVVTEGLKSPKFITAITILNELKKLLSDATHHINSRKLFPRELKDCDLIKKRLTDIVNVIYSLESMLYVIADISDRYDIDTSLENALVQLFAVERGLEMVSKCMSLLGSKAYDCSFPYEKLWRDLKGFSFFPTPTILKLYISLIGLEYSGNVLREAVIKTRNPFNYPSQMFKVILRNQKLASDKPKLILKLYMNLHPSLKQSADYLEYCVLRLQFAVESLFSRHGSEIVNRQLELERLCFIAMDIFAMTSVLSRASHSYCTGMQNSDQELQLARIICFQSFSRVKTLVNEILSGDHLSGDFIDVDIGSFILNKESYFIEHPMKHTV